MDGSCAPSARVRREGSELARHLALRDFNRERLRPRLGASDIDRELRLEHEFRLVEARFVEEERALVAAEVASAPRAADAFVAWFEGLKEHGPGQGDALFPWLAEHAEIEDMRWFLGQEVAGEAGFDDLVALTQIKLPAGPKVELARNYWDEMGQGRASAMHGAMLERLATELQLEHRYEPVWESLALGNLMIALATTRRYAYQSLGALGVIELTAPGRAALVNAGLKRLGVAGAARQYFALHATLDVRHSQAWNREVLHALVSADSNVAPLIAEGALMRLHAGARCFARYRSELNAPALVAHAG